MTKDDQNLERSLNKFFHGYCVCPIDGVLCNRAEPKECYRCGYKIGYSEGYDDCAAEMEPDPSDYINEGHE